MSKVQYEVSVSIGKYINKEGQEKNRYQRIGSVIETKNGPMLKLDCIPIAEDGWKGWAYLNVPKPKEDNDMPF
jgi:hypothetical protein